MSLNVQAIEEKEIKNLKNNVKSQSEILYISTTKNKYSIGFVNGFMVLDKQGKVKYQETTAKGVSIIEVFDDEDIVAVVGNGKEYWEVKSSFDNKQITHEIGLEKCKVFIWNCKERKEVRNIECNQEIRGLRVHKDYIAIVMFDNVSIYSQSGKFVQLFKSYSNPTGMCAISHVSKLLLAFPDTDKGVVQVVNLNSMDYETFKAHDNDIEMICLSQDGIYMATASSKGTIIRIVELKKGNLIKELRRGSKPTQIYSLSFSLNNQYLICSASSGTIHLFDLDKNSVVNDILETLNLSFEKSIGQIRNIEGKSICCFDNTKEYQFMVTCITSNGYFYILNFREPKTPIIEEKIKILF